MPDQGPNVQRWLDTGDCPMPGPESGADRGAPEASGRGDGRSGRTARRAEVKSRIGDWEKDTIIGAVHREVSAGLEAGLCLATPCHSWERGLNEHANGLVRQYFPKGTDLTRVPALQCRLQHTAATGIPSAR